ncbi:XRE family transcriptional regulator [Ornithobacterium rhinotracheale]|uniref:helix-turn-helix domain-containing protein n=1 Tax=Ornithobacterium rhinotracheale TaxID=28251 RepID=UPI00129C4476|nr:helix-turn-helix transcriptional regulator [Ornithobacterium rhinotracheale]MRI64184.1 XRE family transcriptional regulator [Ornithobacterium rhinotracheale]MRJ09082.1 XRE family transcriptional regulator [Ornithobacterium rhinotracheale]UOH77853.1 helix-turn-helix transcriptional regulator [Ornithobacterium rhinotracheale]
MEVNAIIERANDGTFSIYLKETNLGFGLIGTGKSVEEAKEDFMVCIEEVKEIYEEEGNDFPELEVKFHYDTASFLQYYSKYISLAGLQRLTGVSQGQLSHYLNGHRNPSAKTTEKIQNALQEFGKELQQLHMI